MAITNKKSKDIRDYYTQCRYSVFTFCIELRQLQKWSLKTIFKIEGDWNPRQLHWYHKGHGFESTISLILLCFILPATQGQYINVMICILFYQHPFRPAFYSSQDIILVYCKSIINSHENRSIYSSYSSVLFSLPINQHQVNHHLVHLSQTKEVNHSLS